MNDNYLRGYLYGYMNKEAKERSIYPAADYLKKQKAKQAKKLKIKEPKRRKSDIEKLKGAYSSKSKKKPTSLKKAAALLLKEAKGGLIPRVLEGVGKRIAPAGKVVTATGEVIDKSIPLAKKVKRGFSSRSAGANYAAGTPWKARDMGINPVGNARMGTKLIGRTKGLIQDANAVARGAVKATDAAGKLRTMVQGVGGPMQAIKNYAPKIPGLVKGHVSKIPGAVKSTPGALKTLFKGTPAALTTTALTPAALNIGKVSVGGAAKKALPWVAAADMGLDAGQQMFTTPDGKFSWDVNRNIYNNAQHNLNLGMNNHKQHGLGGGLWRNAVSGAGNPVRNIMAASQGITDNAYEWGRVAKDWMTSDKSADETVKDQHILNEYDKIRTENPAQYQRLLANQQKQLKMGNKPRTILGPNGVISMAPQTPRPERHTPKAHATMMRDIRNDRNLERIRERKLREQAYAPPVERPPWEKQPTEDEEAYYN